jgi:hypothetical protein
LRSAIQAESRVEPVVGFYGAGIDHRARVGDVATAMSLWRQVGLVAVLVLCGGCTGLSPLDYPPPPTVAPAAVTHEPMTLPRFLGLDKICRRTAVLARAKREHLAEFMPALAPKPMPIPLSHPDNADSPSPAVANVHKLQKKKAAAAVKVKAVAALAQFDCAADPLVEEGLLAALHDADADVREAAVEAVLRSTRGCRRECGGCCSPSIRARLTQMVFDKTDACCWVEPSPRARRLARLALDACGGPLATDRSVSGTGKPREVPPADKPQ